MSADAAAVEQLAALVRHWTGNVIPPDRFGFLGEVAERRARAVGLGQPADYVHALAMGDLPDEWQSLVSLLTIKESYFFRSPQQFEAIERQVLPRLLRVRAARRELRIWSAACARGEEPATLAMVLAEHPGLAGWDWRILATDIDQEALAGARRGLYGERAVAQVPGPLLERHFTRRGKLFELAPSLLARIDYRLLNLAEPPYVRPGEPEPEQDLILLRNVLIYFPRDLQVEVMAHVARALARRGVLFLGASETLWQIQDELEAVDLGGCYAYRHRRGRPAAAAAPDLRAALPEPAPVGQGAPAAGSAAPPPAGTPPSRAAAKAPAAPPLSVWRGKPDSGPAARASGGGGPPPGGFTEEGATAGSVPSGGRTAQVAAPAAAPPRGAAELLLGAVRALAASRPEGARAAVDEALAADPSEPAAHVLDGFLHDLAGRAEEAAASYRAALYLDPALFQPRILLADCLLRLGRRDRAGHEFREVLAALEAGRERSLALFEELPLPDRGRALRRCREALKEAR